MARKPDIALKKHAKQARSIATVAAIEEAATYILTRDGLAGFTSNKVAERAGVNIASFFNTSPIKRRYYLKSSSEHGKGSLRGWRQYLLQRKNPPPNGCGGLCAS